MTQFNAKQRTQWAEAHVEQFLSLPLVHEFVFRSPQTIDGTQKEVADFLLLQEDSGVLISQKCQEDPLARTAEKTELWARKKAKQPHLNYAGHFGLAAEEPFGVTILGGEEWNCLMDYRRLCTG